MMKLSSLRTQKVLLQLHTPESNPSCQVSRQGNLDPVNLFPGELAREVKQVSSAFDMELGSLQQQIELCETEYRDALATQKAPEKKYAFKGVTKNQGGTQCSKCHLFVKHIKRSCKLSSCVSAEMCRDPSQHKGE